MKFSDLAPWGDYEMISLDYQDHIIVYSCTPIVGGAAKLEYLWILTRKNFNIGDADHTEMRDRMFKKIRQILPLYDIEKNLRATA